MSKDLIKRSDAINLCGKWRNRTNEHHDKNGWYIADTLLKAIKELPSADRPQEWIPCSERMPENGHYYLWCSDMGRVQSDYYWDGFEKGQKYGYNIVAWMPLPKPWKGADDE